MITAAVLTHAGRVRQYNEDTVVVPGLISVGSLSTPVAMSYQHGDFVFAVVDGMGGHRGGQEASRLVAQQLATQPISDIVKALNAANELLYEAAEQSPRLAGMGATVAGILLTDAGAATGFNVGDARVYQWSQGYLMLLSTDDRPTPDSHVVTQSLGGSDRPTGIEVHTTQLELHPNDRLLICSDGLSEAAPFETIQSLLAEQSIAAAAGRLLQAALDRGAPDNVSLIIVERDGDG
jgi:serine/threonine protein phosphatase PrpC